MANFELVPALRQFVNAMVNTPRPLIGDKLPISIGRRYSYHQTIVIFPQDGLDFIYSRDFYRILTFAEVFDCMVFIHSSGDIPTIHVVSYHNGNL